MKLLTYLIVLCLLSLFSCRNIDSNTFEKLNLFNLELGHSLEMQKDLIEVYLEKLKKSVLKNGNTTHGLELVKKAEKISLEVAKFIGKIENIKPKIIKEKYGIVSQNIFAKTTILEDTPKFVLFLDSLKEKHKITNKIAYQINEKEFRGKYNLLVWSLLTIKQIDLLKIEVELLKKFITETPEHQEHWDIKAFATAESNVITLGETFKLNLFLTQVLVHPPIQVTCNGEPVPVENGIGKVRFKATQIGEQSWNGAVKLNYRGRDTTFTFQKRYTVVPRK